MSHNKPNSGIAKNSITSLLMFLCFLSLSAQADILQSTGVLTLLRVHEVGSKFGPRGDQIDVEVVVKISSEPNRSFGFTLREDSKLPAHTGMLNILRDAFNHNHNVTLVYDIDLTENDVNAPNKNGILIRAWVTKRKYTKLK